jgi:Kef-type K+ transport system membrane component KefB
MIDDVLSLILLAMIGSASGSGQKPKLWGPSEGTWAVAIPLLSSVAFMAATAGIARCTPAMVGALRRLPRCQALGNDAWNRVLVMCLLVYSAALVAAAWGAQTTFLLGAFMAGVSFSSIEEAVPAWDANVPAVAVWTSRLFFASIGFAVPVRQLFDADALLFGLVLTAVAVASKVVTGVWDWQNRWVIGWAMVGRGELGFVMAEEAFSTGLTGSLAFSITVWALLISTLVSPIMFRKLLAAQAQAEARLGQPAELEGAPPAAEPVTTGSVQPVIISGKVESHLTE